MSIFYYRSYLIRLLSVPKTEVNSSDFTPGNWPSARHGIKGSAWEVLHYHKSIWRYGVLLLKEMATFHSSTCILSLHKMKMEDFLPNGPHSLSLFTSWKDLHLFSVWNELKYETIILGLLKWQCSSIGVMGRGWYRCWHLSGLNYFKSFQFEPNARADFSIPQNDLMSLKSQLRGWTDLMLENVEITNDMDVYIYVYIYILFFLFGRKQE